VIGFDPEFSDHLGLVDNSKTHTLLKTKLKEFGHPAAMVKFVEAPRPHDFQKVEIKTSASTGGNGGSGGDEPAGKEDFVFDKEQFKDDPLIKKALEIFKGEIVDVRK
jgi:hypothetical protein